MPTADANESTNIRLDNFHRVDIHAIRYIPITPTRLKLKNASCPTDAEYPESSINFGIQLMRKYRVLKQRKNAVQSVIVLRRCSGASNLSMTLNRLLSLTFSPAATAGNSDSVGFFSFLRIPLTRASAFSGRRSNRYLRDSGISIQATRPIVSVNTPPNQNIPRQPYSGMMIPATTEVIMAPIGYPDVTTATDAARYLSGLYSADSVA